MRKLGRGDRHPVPLAQLPVTVAPAVAGARPGVQMWIGLPSTPIAASFTASEWVGCAWQV